MSCCCCVSWLILPVIGYFVYKFFFAKKNEKPEIREKEWKKNTVYLYQFPRATTLPSLSPFCLKIETLLRINNIPYENRFITMSRSKYGLVPFVELNGEHIADSQIIEERLKKHFDVEPLADKKDEAFARTVARMVENHTFFLLIKYKILENPSNIVAGILKSMNVPDFLIPVVSPLAAFMFKCKVSKRITAALGMYSDEEFLMLLRKDLETIEEILGLNKFLFGDKISAADCTVFGHLATVFYLPYATVVSRMLRDEYPTLVEYQERIKKEVFADDFEQK